MKTSVKIIVGVIIIISFFVGFLIASIFNYPKTDKSLLKGTVGKINNYRNIKVSENDIKLRSELQSNNLMLGQYQKYYAFHYTSLLKLEVIVDNAIKASDSAIEFSETSKDKIESLSNFKDLITESSKEILVLVSTLQNLSESDQQNTGLLINNANNAIAQIKFKEAIVTDFIEALELFFSTNDPASFPELKKAHDLLLAEQVRSSVIANNKPMIKYLDQKSLLGSKEELAFFSNELNNEVKLLMYDQKNLEDQVLKCMDTEVLKVGDYLKLDVIIWSDNNSFNSDEFLKVIESDEGLNLVSESAKLNDLLNCS